MNQKLNKELSPEPQPNSEQTADNISVSPSIANAMLAVRACEGNCVETHGSHRGKVKEVIISGNNWQKMTFFYCQNAIEEDIKRGFNVDAVLA